MNFGELFERAVDWLREMWRRLTDWVDHRLRRLLDSRVLDWLAANLDTILAIRDFTVHITNGLIRVVDQREVARLLQHSQFQGASTDAEMARRYRQAIAMAPAASQTRVPMNWRESKAMRDTYGGSLMIDVHNPMEGL
ncbi:hypothetical protein [Actinacidiphila guanduensis]|jgi:hypothetical protein|uniref:Uncharacterized protein n=1 Tax=Actinacidiphila guanduensis TaxID=310781 RepID=A0A1G9X6B2_9ACTN|nr:hypothetical protein [Actinacidiphila guanduensis]SDM92310.1 hypothetical protein SAMN05216259_10215 [Actinacidiphila guanduensis]